MTTINDAPAKNTSGLSLFFSVALQKTTILGGLKIAIVVGIAVNLINQGEQIFALQLSQVSLPKLLITFCIPFCVSIYNSTMTRLHYDPGVRAIADATLTCGTCGHSQEISEGELVRDCVHCSPQGKQTRWSRATA
jgi:hypothetical protein